MPEEQQVITRKYAMPPLSQMDTMAAVAHVQGLVKRIKIITGWDIPELEEDRSILYAEMYRHFCESWPTYNAEEIAHAVRSHGSSVKAWGKDINLTLIDECLATYQHQRREASHIEEQKRTAANTRQLPPPSDWREMLEYCYQKFLVGKKINVWTMPFEMYDQCVTDRFLSPEVFERFTVRATEWLFGDFARQESLCCINRDKVAKKEIESKFALLVEQGEQFADVHRIAKRLAMLFLFQELKKARVKNMYVYEPDIKDENM